jgi:Fur family ferric uptake transcriptional regulator
MLAMQAGRFRLASPRGGGHNAPSSANREDPRIVTSRLERLCIDKGLKMTEQRRVIARVLSDAADHPDVEQVHKRATKIDSNISLATVYRTVRLFEEASILERHDFGDGRARYEEIPEAHHDHLIDIQSGRVIEFSNEEIERLQHRVAEELGYKLVGHRLELYAVPSKGRDAKKS